MKNKYNTLHKYIYEYSQKEYMKKTINGLFRAILEPVVSNQKFESCILLRLKNEDENKSILQRLSFTGGKIISFNDSLKVFGFESSQKNSSLWGETEFLVILGQRYSAALIWDYSLSQSNNSSDVCMLFNSKLITEISKKILENSIIDFSNLISKYSPDRRENLILNGAIKKISEILNDKNEEIMFNEEEKKHLVSEDDTLKTAEIVAQKAKFIAHEIKNNLSIINLYSKILEKRLENIKTNKEIEDSVKNAIKNISNSSGNISDLISDLRCISALYITEFSIKNIVSNVISQCEEKAKKAGVTIHFDCKDDYIVSSDKTKFECALINIIFNAIEACKNGCRINISCRKDNDKIITTIKNDGEKIPENVIPRIFDIDFTTKTNGNGLGLAICKSQLEAAGASIYLLSSDDKETIFEIVLSLK